MGGRFEHRLLLLVVPLVALVLASVVALGWYATRERLTAESLNALTVTERNLELWLETREQRLREASAVLARDFGFRTAVASNDPATLLSALENLRRRIAASRLQLLALDGRVTVDTAADEPPLPLPAGLDLADAQPSKAVFVEHAGRVEQLTLVPILAPDPIAWIAATRGIKAADLRGFASQSTLPTDVTIGRIHAGGWSGATTAAGPEHADLADVVARHRTGAVATGIPAQLELRGRTYVTLLRQLTAAEPGSTFVSLLEYSIDDALQPYQSLLTFLLLLGGGGLVAVTTGLLLIARSVTSPIRALDAAAIRIRSGDYSGRVGLARRDELGRLGETFDAMVDAVASRERQIVHQSLHDPVTGLPNLAGFTAAVERRVAEAGASFSVLLFEIQHLRTIRNTVGHEIADRLLARVAERLTRACKSTDLVGRLGVGTFAVLLDRADPGRVDVVGDRLLGSFADPVSVDGINVDVLARLGLASFPEHGSDARELLRHAEVAVSIASAAAPFAQYDPTSDPYRPELLSRLGEIRNGIARGEFEIYLQPKVRLADGMCAGAEALLRWRHPQLGLLPPGEFIPLAETTGVITLLTRFALAAAIGIAAGWRKRGDVLTIAVNLSTNDLRDASLPAYVAQHLLKAGLPPEALVLEITESAVMDRPDEALRILEALRALGVGLSVDDFGTGYSSLSYLRSLPVTELKLDRSFITALARSPHDQVIVRASLDIARSLGLKTVAEGVEDDRALEWLRDMGCQYAQGYLMSAPVAVASFDVFLKTSPWGRRGREAAGSRPLRSVPAASGVPT